MKLLARLLVVLGAVAVAWVLFGEGPRDVVLVYDLPAGGTATGLQIEIVRRGEVLRRAEFRLATGEAGAGSRQVRHEVRLPEGDYDLVWSLRGPGGDARGARPVAVREDGTIVVPLGR